ncbi:MAG TPA: hypothetical protein VGO29_14170 [Solirubrobacteraceae bacterium]|jgi:hypothetical protein|nr:hypothetical protein [Solirubrobacteraceae bacterium]
MPPAATTTSRPARALIGAVALALACLACAFVALMPTAALGKAAGARAKSEIDAPALFRSRLLWATIDVCNPPDQPQTLGIRGSMPGDHHAHDTMYMRFRLQYLNTTTKAWTDLAKGASSGYASVGTGADSRQAGRSFQLNPVPGQPAFTLRGVVGFQWRRGKTVLAQTSLPTTAGRDSLAGADPVGFSAASCLIG